MDIIKNIISNLMANILKFQTTCRIALGSNEPCLHFSFKNARVSLITDDMTKMLSEKVIFCQERLTRGSSVN